MKRFVVVLALFATPAMAEVPPWVGIWAAEPDWCQYADRIGSHNPAPIEITETELNGLENFCAITGVKGNDDYRYWELSMMCSAEGSTYDETALLMLDGEDTLWRWYGVGDPARFTRCEG